jgi:hypothetical protein
MLEGSKEVMDEIRHFEKVTQEIAGGINEMASGKDQINNVCELTTKNRKGIDALVREVSKFKVG